MDIEKSKLTEKTENTDWYFNSYIF
jgi:hypothetical protein